LIDIGFGISDVEVGGNTFNQNGAAGIALLGTNLGIISIHDNNASGNGFDPGTATNDPLGTEVLNDGIYVDVQPGSTTLRANHANFNADHGVQASGATDGGGNTASG